MDTVIDFGLVVALAALDVFYWSHCAKPALKSVGAKPLTLRVVPAIGVASLLGIGVQGVLRFTDRPVPDFLVWVYLATGICFVLAWPRPRLVARFLGGSDPLEELRLRVWGLRANTHRFLAVGDSASRRDAEMIRTWLANQRPSSETREFIDAWLQVAAFALDGVEPRVLQQDLRRIIRDEARKLWPTGDRWRAATPQTDDEADEPTPARPPA
jgi:hypothetical protein